MFAAEAKPPAAALMTVASGTPIRTHAGRRMVTVLASPGPDIVMRPPAATAMQTACPASSGACHVCRMHPDGPFEVWYQLRALRTGQGAPVPISGHTCHREHVLGSTPSWPVAHVVGGAVEKHRLSVALR